MSSYVIYNPTTGAITGSYSFAVAADAVESLVAANTPTGLSALAIDADHAAVINQGGWIVQGGALVAVVPTDAELLAAAQAAQLQILTASYASAKAANVAYLGTSFMADDDSQQMFAHALVAYTAVAETPSGFYAVDANYAKVPMTLPQLQGLVTAIAGQVWTVFQRWVAAKEALAAATTVAAVQAITW
jgi:hypothetical protein